MREFLPDFLVSLHHVLRDHSNFSNNIKNYIQGAVSVTLSVPTFQIARLTMVPLKALAD